MALKSFIQNIDLGEGSKITVIYDENSKVATFELYTGSTMFTKITSKLDSIGDYLLSQTVGKFADICIDELCGCKELIVEYIGDLVVLADKIRSANDSTEIALYKDQVGDLHKFTPITNRYQIGDYKIYDLYDLGHFDVRYINTAIGDGIKSLNEVKYEFIGFISSINDANRYYNLDNDVVSRFVAEWIDYYTIMKDICKSDDRDAIIKHFKEHINDEIENYYEIYGEDFIDEILR